MKNVKQYQVLISTPSDVQEELKSVEKVIDNFNRTFGLYNGIALLPVHWSKDVFPQSGGRPQSLINSQIVNESDFVISVLWTRFGTPTGKYDSGTEEEIEIMLREGKQGFLYISNRSVPLDKVDYSQYEKIKEFKGKYKGKGLYWEYDSIEEFEKILYNHLTKYFMYKGNEVDIDKSNLSIKAYNGDEFSNNIMYYDTNYSEYKYFTSLLEEITETISKINNIKIPLKEEKEKPTAITNEKINDLQQYMTKNVNRDFLSILDEVKVSQEDKEAIEKFVRKYTTLNLSEDFYNLGNCTKKLGGNILTGRTFYEPKGSEQEIEKYNLIHNLLYNIHQFEDLKKYLSYIDNYKKVWFVVANDGERFDEDITINLYLPKNKFIIKEKIENPPIFALDIIKGSIGDLLVPSEKHNIKKYPDYKKHNKFKIENPLASSNEIYQGEIDEFREELEKIFAYNIFNDEDFEIVQFNLSYLKQQEFINFPTFLLLNDSIDEIKYDITSKYNKKVEGVMKVK